MKPENNIATDFAKLIELGYYKLHGFMCHSIFSAIDNGVQIDSTGMLKAIEDFMDAATLDGAESGTLTNAISRVFMDASYDAVQLEGLNFSRERVYSVLDCAHSDDPWEVMLDNTALRIYSDWDNRFDILHTARDHTVKFAMQKLRDMV